MARLRIQLQDRPGALFSVVKLFEQHQINIVEIYHQRVFTSIPAKDAFIDIECEARDAEHLDRLVAGLREAGLPLHHVDIPYSRRTGLQQPRHYISIPPSPPFSTEPDKT